MTELLQARAVIKEALAAEENHAKERFSFAQTSKG
jgi:hypothetical protein